MALWWKAVSGPSSEERKSKLLTKMRQKWEEEGHSFTQLTDDVRLKLKGACLKKRCHLCEETYSFPFPNDGSQGDVSMVVMVLICGHCFHFDCLWDWLSIHASCPQCRLATGGEHELIGIPLTIYWQLVGVGSGVDSPC